MDESELFNYELEKRLSSDMWDMSMARRTIAAERRRRARRLALVSGGAAAAAVAAALITVSVFSPRNVPAESRIVMQQVSGAYNASLGIASTDDIDPVDIEISEALWSR